MTNFCKLKQILRGISRRFKFARLATTSYRSIIVNYIYTLLKFPITNLNRNAFIINRLFFNLVSLAVSTWCTERGGPGLYLENKLILLVSGLGVPGSAHGVNWSDCVAHYNYVPVTVFSCLRLWNRKVEALLRIKIYGWYCARLWHLEMLSARFSKVIVGTCK